MSDTKEKNKGLQIALAIGAGVALLGIALFVLGMGNEEFGRGTGRAVDYIAGAIERHPNVGFLVGVLVFAIPFIVIIAVLKGSKDGGGGGEHH